jgi:phenylalanyl-tRNA synthetase beta chain
LKKNYLALLKNHYLKSQNILEENIVSSFSKGLAYQIDFTLSPSKKSPLWLKNKLKNHGIEPKILVNDILNLVLTEFGITFGTSFSKITNTNSKPFIFERLETAEMFKTNLASTINLPPGSFVLKDKEKNIISVFSIGNSFLDIHEIENNLRISSSVISLKEKNLENFSLTFLFGNLIADNNFEQISNSKQSLPFLRKSLQQNLRMAFQRILSLLEITASADILKIYSSKPTVLIIEAEKILKLEKKLLKDLLNLDSYDNQIFQEAGLKLVCESNLSLYFAIPTSRRDLERSIDLIEEYSRFVGYRNFKEILPPKQTMPTKQELKPIQFITSFFLNHGFHEVFTNSVHENKQQKNQLNLTNPLNLDFSSLRTSLFPGLLNVFEMNLKSGASNLNFFEIGRVFKRVDNKIVEQDKLSGIFQFKILRESSQPSFNWLVVKGFLEMFLSNFGHSDLIFEPLQKNNLYFHPTRSVNIKSKNKVLGTFGEVNPKLKNFFASKGPVYLFDFNFIHFKSYRMKNEITLAKESSKYPSITKDLSFSINKNQNFTELKNYIKKSTKQLKNFEFFDLYQEKEILDNKINIAIRLEFQSINETLTNDKIEEEILLLKDGLQNLFQVDFKI